ncbi:MAG TPA: hypothetical protein VK208_18720 [Pyrinomonadaceae bacterium]|nr:hypothetical protein [Pyrinomonadaceae bacterium]
MKQYVEKVLGVTAFVLVLAWAVSMSLVRGHASDVDDGQHGEESFVRLGLEISPVPLNLAGKNRDLVGLGSYIVNAHAACNDCHSPGPAVEYVNGGNPYFGQPKKVNPDVYLGGGQDFGPLIPGSAHIISRNLTPDKTGRPEGGRSFAEFREILKTGIDLDHLHPTCADGMVNESCVPPPFDGNLLQVMTWPTLQNMSDRDIRAIYEYLSAIPCVAGPPAPDPRHNDCE